MPLFVDIEARLDKEKLRDELRDVVRELVREELAAVKESDQ
ncbi:hypothetical protein [Mycobacterium malmoense]|nr:hypothetical protein [Mycobacterium malmoense]